MTNKKQTAMGQLSFMIDSLIEEGSNLPITDERTRGYLEGLFTIKKLIEEEQIKKEQEQLHNAFDEGYFNGAELIEFTADQYIGENYLYKESNIYL